MKFSNNLCTLHNHLRIGRSCREDNCFCQVVHYPVHRRSPFRPILNLTYEFTPIKLRSIWVCSARFSQVSPTEICIIFNSYAAYMFCQSNLIYLNNLAIFTKNVKFLSSLLLYYGSHYIFSTYESALISPWARKTLRNYDSEVNKVIKITFIVYLFVYLLTFL